MDINLEVSTNIYNMATYEVVLALILGIFVCLFGYRLKKLVIFLAFFLIGYSIMQRIMPVLNANLPAIAESSLWQTILPICGGLLLSLLGFSIEKLCVALLVCNHRNRHQPIRPNLGSCYYFRSNRHNSWCYRRQDDQTGNHHCHGYRRCTRRS